MTILSKLMDMLGRRRVITDRTGKIPYLIRYYVFLKDRKWFPFNITLHKVLVSDEPTLHDHPWNWGAFIISGGYWEHTPKGTFWRGPGSLRIQKSTDLHWLELKKNKPCYTLFWHGVRKRTWGFQTDNGWVDYRTFLKNRLESRT
jgi:hypothetical protein